MLDVIIFIVTFASIIAFLYGYYRLCKWLTYDFFSDKPEKTGDWVDDYVVVYGKKTLGVLLLLPVAILIIAVAIFAIIGASNNRSGGFSSSRSSRSDDDEYGNYVIQYRRHGSWIDGPGSNNESVAESMFDNFLSSDSRSENRCRLVYKVNGRVKRVLSTN
jgi:hypothetical protein